MAYSSSQILIDHSVLWIYSMYTAWAWICCAQRMKFTFKNLYKQHMWFVHLATIIWINVAIPYYYHHQHIYSSSLSAIPCGQDQLQAEQSKHSAWTEKIDTQRERKRAELLQIWFLFSWISDSDVIKFNWNDSVFFVFVRFLTGVEQYIIYVIYICYIYIWSRFQKSTITWK